MSIAINVVVLASAIFNVGGPADEAARYAPFGNNISTCSVGITHQS